MKSRNHLRLQLSIDSKLGLFFVFSSRPGKMFQNLRVSSPMLKWDCTCSSHNGSSLWVHCQVEHSVGVASQCRHLLHPRVFPNVDFVLRIAVSAYKFVYSFAEHKVADLGASVNNIYWCGCQCVPESDGSVCRSSS